MATTRTCDVCGLDIEPGSHRSSLANVKDGDEWRHFDFHDACIMKLLRENGWAIPGA